MFDQTLYTMSSILDLQIGMVPTVDGRFDEKRLDHAVRLSIPEPDI
jgi:hypothetical protein